MIIMTKIAAINLLALFMTVLAINTIVGENKVPFKFGVFVVVWFLVTLLLWFITGALFIWNL